ncbi:hypothetical protein [Roseibacillus ishigakijimensis]|uniref:Uncharacterized protein n=1 Tax=Roseibacillus ishigakijimensis TaxID=454146 RepID=A0A934VIJ1_9BACT|nr:hypothetical protein [Roseibacillus ishigakijimensis]MBK1835128.1 hypothetical protein [Roseibacillus ishigakijimensis]
MAEKLPQSLQGRPARTLMITGGITCLLVLLVKPRKKRKKAKNSPAESTIKAQLFAFFLSTAQPLVRVWLTEHARKWMRK